MRTYYREGEKCVSYTSEELKAKRARDGDKTDWAALDALTDEQIEAAIAADPDDFTPTDEEYARSYRPNLGEKPPSEEVVAQRLRDWEASRSEFGQPKRILNTPKANRHMNVNLMLPPYLVQWLKDQPESQGILVEKALVKQFNIEAPA